jgi:hypothetical protein
LKERDMIEAELEFRFSMTHLVLEELLTLPEALRPTHKSLGEDEVGTPIGDARIFLRTFELPSIGVLLRNSIALYDLRRSRNGNLICCSYFDAIPYGAVKEFLIHMAIAHPIFGFACAAGELEHRNRITTKLGVNTVESRVGRDTQKYIPGLYWWTLLPASLAEKHGVPLSTILAKALEHIELDGKQHLLRLLELNAILNAWR